MHSDGPAREMLFVRQFPYFLGGHLKVFDYLGHVAASERYRPRLYMVPGSLDPSPYVPAGTRRAAQVAPADAYFVGGVNWKMLDDAGLSTAGVPTVCLVQGLRHLDPRSPHHPFLERAALRVCVSDAVADAVRASGRANGPVASIPNGVDLAWLRAFDAPEKRDAVFIAGAKDAALATAIAEELARAGVACDLAIEQVDRAAFVRRMGACAVTIALPLSIDGFYLPALEAMAVGSALVISDAVGPRTFCADGRNCVVAGPRATAYVEAARALLTDRTAAGALRAAAYRTAAEHSLEAERGAFLRVLADYEATFAR